MIMTKRILTSLCQTLLWIERHQHPYRFTNMTGNLNRYILPKAANSILCRNMCILCSVHQMRNTRFVKTPNVNVTLCNNCKTPWLRHLSTKAPSILQFKENVYTSPSAKFYTSPFLKGKSEDFTDLSLKNEILVKYLDNMTEEYSNTSDMIGSGEDSQDKGKLTRRLNELSSLVFVYKTYRERKKDLSDAKMLVTTAVDSADHELSDLAKEEVKELEEQLMELEEEIIMSLTPQETGDQRDIILEVAAGVGGTEAMLFTKQMFDMYAHYASYNDWSFTTIAQDESGMGGLRKASASISGYNVYKYMKYEGGVHRVQRVPKTEKSGRVHTSTITVAIMPQPSEIEVQIKPSDLRIDVFRASGAGGQHVNTTNSAVRIVHIPSGMAVECQSNRSQIRNKELALQILRSRLYEKELQQQMKDQKFKRKLQVGSSGRSEKIRTYNFMQDRITDHRISGNSHNLDVFLSGGEELHNMIERLQLMSERENIVFLLEEFDAQCKAKTK